MSLKRNENPLVIQVMPIWATILAFIFIAMSILFMYLGVTQKIVSISVLGGITFLFFGFPLFVRTDAKRLAKMEAERRQSIQPRQSMGADLIENIKAVGFIIALLAAGLLIFFGLHQIVGLLSSLSVGTLLIIVILMLLFR